MSNLSSKTAVDLETPQAIEALEFLTSIVSSACQFKASDIHIRSGHQIMMRLDGRIRQVKGSPEMSNDMIERLIFPLMSKHHISSVSYTHLTLPTICSV